MSKPRYNIAGVRDYTGVGLEEILSDITLLYDETQARISDLKKVQDSVQEHSDRLDDPDDITRVIQYHISLFDDYAKDLWRLVDELPQEVADRHIRIVESIHESAVNHYGGMILQFKKDHIYKTLRDETLRYLLDNIYSSVREHILEVRMLYAVKDQLTTFLGKGIISKHVEESQIEGTAEKPETEFEPLKVPANAEWKDVFIRFCGDKEIEVKVRRQSFGVLTFSRCGFSDLRTGKPDRQWTILRFLAKMNGDLYLRDAKVDGQRIRNIQKGISLLRHQLIRLFRITGSPISAYSRRTGSYKSNFMIGLPIMDSDGNPSSMDTIQKDIQEMFEENEENVWQKTTEIIRTNMGVGYK